jgi:anti-anti-sigma factor
MELLTLSSYRLGTWSVVDVRGELDIASGAQLGDALDMIIATRHPAWLIVDFTNLDFCDASGLSELVSAYHAARDTQGELRLACPEGLTRRLLKITELSDLIAVFDTLDLAVAAPVGASDAEGDAEADADSGAPRQRREEHREYRPTITEIAIERVAFTCGNCWRTWNSEYDVQRYRDESGTEWEYFAHDGVPVASPYDPEGAATCRSCGHRWIGHLSARRRIPVAPGRPGTPRRLVTGPDARAERHVAPPLAPQVGRDMPRGAVTTAH